MVLSRVSQVLPADISPAISAVPPAVQAESPADPLKLLCQPAVQQVLCSRYHPASFRRNIFRYPEAFSHIMDKMPFHYLLSSASLISVDNLNLKK